MSEQIKSLIDAIASNDTATALSTFNDIVGEKVAVALDNYREEVASTLFGESVKKPLKEDEDLSIEELDETYRFPNEDEINKVKVHASKNHPNKDVVQIAVDKKTKNIEYIAKDKSGKMSGHSLNEDFSIEDFSIEELEEFMVSEEYEQLDELSKTTLGNYIKKANKDYGLAKMFAARGNQDAKKYAIKRATGISTAVKKLTKE